MSVIGLLSLWPIFFPSTMPTAFVTSNVINTPLIKSRVIQKPISIELVSNLVNAEIKLQTPDASAAPTAPQTPRTVISNPDPNAVPLGIDESVKLALKNNEQMSIANAQWDRARGRVQETDAAFNPTLNGTYQYTQYDKKTTADFSNGAGGTQSVVLQNIYSQVMGLTIGIPIDISGVLAANRAAQRISERVSEQEIFRVRQQLALDVKNAYFNVVRNSNLVDVAAEAVKNSEARLKLAEQQLAAGVSPKFDVTRAKTTVAQNQQSFLTSKNALDLSKKAFNNVIGRTIDTPVSLKEVNDLPPVNSDAAAYESQAIKARPDLEQSRQNVELQKKLIRAAQRSVLPSFNLSGQLNYNPQPAGFGSRKTVVTGVALVSLPIFDGGLARARVRQQRAEVSIAQAGLSQLTRTVTFDVQQAFLNLQNAKDRLAVANTALTQAKEGLDLARIRYSAGVSIQVEVSDAELAYTQAETNVVNARYDYLSAYAALQKAIGEPVNP